MKRKLALAEILKAALLFIMLNAAGSVRAQTTITNFFKPVKIGLSNNQPATGDNLANTNWILEPVENFYRIKNAATGDYLHNQSGKLECGKIQLNWWSAQWTLKAVDDKKFIINRWTGDYLHIEHGPLELSKIASEAWWSARWTIPGIENVSPEKKDEKLVLAQGQIAQFITIVEPNVKNPGIRVQELTIMDNVVAGNKVAHAISFAVYINKYENTIAQLKDLGEKLRSNTTFQIVVTSSYNGYENANSAVTEQRTYSAAKVKSIALRELGVENKSPLLMEVEIDGGTDVKVTRGGVVSVGKLSQKADIAFTSNYSIQLGNLETQRISNFGSVPIGSNNSEKNKFDVTLPASDRVSWSDLLNATGDKVVPTGKIDIMADDMKKVLLSIYLKNISIVNYKSETTDGQSRATVTYGLKAGSISFLE